MTDVEKTIKHLKEGIDFAECRGYEGLANTMRDALELLNEYKWKDGCPCTHCMKWECDEVCEEYKKWKDT